MPRGCSRPPWTGRQSDVLPHFLNRLQDDCERNPDVGSRLRYVEQQFARAVTTETIYQEFSLHENYLHLLGSPAAQQRA